MESWPDPEVHLDLPHVFGARLNQFFVVLNEYQALSLDEAERKRQVEARESFWMWSYRYGWPFRAIGVEYWRHIKAYQPRVMNTNVATIAGFDVPSRPIWTGLALNSILYAIVLLGPVAAWREAVRRRRRRCGWCLQCGYDLRANQRKGCPECGWGRKGEANAAPGSA